MRHENEIKVTPKGNVHRQRHDAGVLCFTEHLERILYRKASVVRRVVVVSN